MPKEEVCSSIPIERFSLQPKKEVCSSIPIVRFSLAIPKKEVCSSIPKHEAHGASAREARWRQTYDNWHVDADS